MSKVIKGADAVELDARGVLHVHGLEVDAEAVELEQAHAALLASVNMVLATHMPEFNLHFAKALGIDPAAPVEAPTSKKARKKRTKP
jgi:hypothetical protein